MAEKRFISERIQKIAEEIIENASILESWKDFYKDEKIKIIFLESDKIKISHGQTVCADCEKIADSKRWAIGADFVITVYSKNVTHFSDGQMKVLLLHELMHVGIEDTGKGEFKKYIIPHDLQDFYYIVDKYGPLWDRTDITKNKQLKFDF